jgi:hypothetical protein
MSKRASTRVAARVASKRAFARVHPDLGLVAHSPEVLGMAQCLDSRSRMPRAYGAYCFKLSFTPVAVIANRPVQTSLDNSRKTNMDMALNALPASKMQPW